MVVITLFQPIGGLLGVHLGPSFLNTLEMIDAMVNAPVVVPPMLPNQAQRQVHSVFQDSTLDGDPSPPSSYYM